MRMVDLIKYNSLVEIISNYNYNQLLSFFNFTCTFSTKAFKVLECDKFRYILYIEPNTNLIQCYDLNTTKILSKINIFLIHFHTLDFFEIKQSLNNNSLPICKEFDLNEPKNLFSILSLYFKNIPNSYFAKLNTSQTFLSFVEHPSLNNNITFNKDLNKFSLPLFSDGNYSVCDFIDFDSNSYNKRYCCEFGIWYSKKLSNSLAIPAPKFANDDHDDEPDITNEISISFNPAALIASLRFFSSSPYTNVVQLLLSEPFSTFSFGRFLGFFSNQEHPAMNVAQKSFFDFDQIHMIYDNSPLASFRDLFSILGFSISSLNFINPEFSLELDSIKYNYIKIYFLKVPVSFKYTDLQEIADSLTELIHKKYCGKGNSLYIDSEIIANVDFLKNYTFYATKHTYGKTKKTMLGFTFPAKTEFLIIFLNYLFTKYLTNFELNSFSSSSIFTDYPDNF